ncbi:MAG: bifunctional 4-hydroxy-2-oxoglutarate aldolase/2-dehydro-3-deoxy-phosphogluconate aldolase [Dorea sp.]|jgi:2-dehydro-3-deoxyphosphogluconate aldolase/(4S)-4-hydroxy-2-oxoglutarate aldolase|nr:bifunctional 4-hydroxy-2-oxoglutarate aldolase/2-dehydro-3-deoxy-phosphogluconate aldolase [Dorea sp.]
MNQTALLPQLEAYKLVPVIKLDSPDDALPLAEALITGGLPVAEITFRTDAARESIRKIRSAYPDMLTGAGTVLSLEQAKAAADAGASFIVSPGMNRDVVEFSIENHIPVFPGACTPTEIMAAMEYELEVVKFFPAKQYGGLDTIKALSAPFPSVRFMPTGGISEANIKDFLAFPKIIACGGSFMASGSLISQKKFDDIRKLTANAAALIKS